MAVELSTNKFLTDAEYKFTVRYCMANLDDKICIATLFALHTGARVSELLLLRKKDLQRDKDKYFVYITATKNSKDREVPIPKWLWKKLHDTDDDRLLPFSYSLIKQKWRKIRPGTARQKPFHCLRHTAALRMYDSSKDVKLTQYFLGHRSIHSTMVYLDYSYNQEHLRKALGL